eukprot:jgi/Bigna1/91285/estExt_fgenesh1_pg.C_950039
MGKDTMEPNKKMEEDNGAGEATVNSSLGGGGQMRVGSGRKRAVIPSGTVKVRTDNLLEPQRGAAADSTDKKQISSHSQRRMKRPVPGSFSIRAKTSGDAKRQSAAATIASAAAADNEPLKYGKEPDPLYDDKLDDNDQKWVQDRYLPHTERTSDAVLNCPACFTVLSFDCQRHSYYPNQYRAMFVQNCKVMLKQTTRPVKGDSDPNAIYHQGVHCAKCDLYVAVRDMEEIYHFFNVLPSENSGDKNAKKAKKKIPKRQI